MSRPTSLRTRLTLSAVVGAAILAAALVTAFNLVLDARLRTDRDNLLRERASTVLRGLGTVDGRLSLIEAPDQGVVDAQTWIFTGEHALEQPASVDSRNQHAADELARVGSGFRTVGSTHTRLAAVAVRRAGRRLGTVVVGASERPYESSASSALIGSVVLGLLTFVAVGALSLWLIRRALHPVARMTAQAADWGEHDLSRRFFAGEPHDELTSLAAVFDGLLSRLAQSLRREQRLTAEISHELRTPLAKIRAEAELAAGRDRPAQQYRLSLQLILGHAQAVQRVLETLLASARTSASGRAPASDAAETARRAAGALDDSLAANGKSIELTCGRPLKVAVEADVLERILAPLLENASRFAQRQISLEIQDDDGAILFLVCDDGPGVDAYQRERIFEPGFRGPREAPDSHSGIGLGLPLARRLARAAGGDIEARASSNGAIFALRLPAIRGPAPA